MPTLKINGKKKTKQASKYRAEKSLEPLMVPIDTIKPDSKNARLHPDRNLAGIRASLEKYGWQRPVLVDAKNVIVAGNGAVEAAKSLGWTHVPVVRTALVGLDRTGYALADNKIAESSEWDYERVSEQLRELLKRADGNLEALAHTGFIDVEIESLLNIDGVAQTEMTKPQLGEPTYRVVVTCKNERDQGALMTRLEKEGYQCQLLMS